MKEPLPSALFIHFLTHQLSLPLSSPDTRMLLSHVPRRLHAVVYSPRVTWLTGFSLCTLPYPEVEPCCG